MVYTYSVCSWPDGKGYGIIRTDQGGKFARSDAFHDLMLKDFGYVVVPKGANSPSQSGGAEVYNRSLAVKVKTLLYGSGLPAKFWSATLLHAVYLHNQLVHSAMGKTPYEGWHGRKPDVTSLNIFGSRVCVKQSGSRRCKLDCHDFTSIFLGYTATDANIIYLDTTTGIVKSCHRAVFDEAWYLQPTRPPAAQLLYDLGLKVEAKPATMADSHTTPPVSSISPITVAWPPLCRDTPENWAPAHLPVSMRPSLSGSQTLQTSLQPPHPTSINQPTPNQERRLPQKPSPNTSLGHLTRK
jgi:hypothetical protein